MLDQLREAKIFSNIDLRSGNHQVNTKEWDVPKTSFKTRYDHNEFVVMSFGFTNAPTIFMELMNRVLKECLDTFVIVLQTSGALIRYLLRNAFFRKLSALSLSRGSIKSS